MVNIHDKYKHIGYHNRIGINKISINYKGDAANGIDNSKIFYISKNKGNGHQKRSDIPYPFNIVIIHKVLRL